MMGAFPLKRSSKKTKWWTELLEGLAFPILLWAARRGRIISGRLLKRLRSRIETSTQNYRGEVIGPKDTPNDCLFMRYLACAGAAETVPLDGRHGKCFNLLQYYLHVCEKFSPGGWGVGYCLIIGMCGAKEYHGFLAVLDWDRVSFWPFWSEIGYGLCTLVLNWVCFLEEPTSLSLGDKTIFFLMFAPTVYVP